MATIYRNRQLMYLSVILFFYFASIGCLAPFLTSHMLQLGFSLTEISFINAISAFFSLAGPVLLGTVAEKRHRYKSVTGLCMLAGSLAFVGLAFVPRYHKLHYRPLADFDCTAGLRVERCVNWISCAEALEPLDNFTSVKLSGCHYRCPSRGRHAPTYPLHVCFNGDDGNLCVVDDPDISGDSLTGFEAHLQSWRFSQEAPSNETAANLTRTEDVSRANVAMCRYSPRGPIVFAQKAYQGISCRPMADDCSVHCKVAFTSTTGEVTSPRQCEEATGDPTTTFWSYLILRSVGDLCLLTTICLMDAWTVWSTVDYEGAYGRIHAWAALGMASLAPFSGALLDHYSDMDGGTDFAPSAFLSTALALVSCALVMSLPIHRQKSIKFQDMPAAASSSFQILEVTCFLLVVLFLGAQWGMLFTFLPVLTAGVASSSTMTGLATSLTFGFSLPFLVISKTVVRNIGKANLLVFALLFYFTRFAGLPFVSSAWWTLPFALMGSFTLCVMWVAAVAYGQALVPGGHGLAMQYVLNIVHFGIGRGIGCIVGGTLITAYSKHAVFGGVACVSAITAILYLTLYHTVLKKRTKKNVPALLNGSWYPLRERYPNGDAKALQPIVVDQDDDVETSPNHRQAVKSSPTG